MLKFAFLLGFLALANAAGPYCYQGSVVYDNEVALNVYASFNLTIERCPDNQQCGQVRWTNTDEQDRTSYVQTTFCYPENLPITCSVIDGEEGVGEVSNCTATTCNMDGCNDFPTNVCYNGTLVYDTSRQVVTLRDYAGTVACSDGEICGMFRYNDFRSEFNYTNYLETAFCFDPNEHQPNCTALDMVPELGEVSNCVFESGAGTEAPFFTQSVPLNRGYRCDVGVLAYSTDMQRVVFAENITDQPCETNQLCGMFRFQNVDDNGFSGYVESGFCIDSIEAFGLSCDFLEKFPNVNNVTNCTSNVCSGDFCEPFTFLDTAPEECPGRPAIGDLQVLPGCTMSELLESSFTCMSETAAALPFTNMTDCGGIVDRSISCMSGVVRDCIQFQSDNMTLCPSVISTIPNFDATFILQEIRRYAMNVTSIESLRMVLEQLSNGTADLSALDMVCSTSPEQLMMGLEMLRNFTDSIGPIGLGTPVCKDDQILDDLIQWGLESFEEMIAATTHRDVCLIFDKMKARLDDAVRNRCYGLDNIGTLLYPVIGPFFSSVVQRAVDITKYFLLELALPGCEEVPYPTHLVCNQGTVAYLLEDRTFPVFDESNTTVCPPNFECGMWRWENTDRNGSQSYVEFGICTYPGVEYPCAALLNETGVAAINECTFERCNDSHRCQEFSKDQCPAVPEDDVAILPRCTIRETLQGGLECMGSFVGGFPYSDRDQCRAEVDNVVRCVRNGMQRCLYGDCETVLDFIPGLRTIYRQVLTYSRDVDSLADALKLLQLDDATIEMVYGGICGDPAVRELVLQLIQNAESQLPDLTFENPVCDDGIVNDIVRWSLTAARQILAAETHQQFCAAFSTLRGNLINAWENRCSLDGLFTFLNSVAPPQLRYQIETGLKIVLEIFSTIEIPNCDQTGVIDCSRFYEGSSSCAVRQAWLCDYVNWKVDFLLSWLNNFNDYVSRNMILDAVNPIGCIYYDSDDLCTDMQQRVCRSGADGCTFCYCQDHRYKNLSRVMEIYRQDWVRWRRAFSRYQRVTQQNQDTCTMN